ncbi:MAG: ketoacyl-ACP synthase III [Deltaproteobacteria bacterium]|nr:ketoacyl-ACP synthase III [Deltaproteobacteria bacterium]
MSKPIRSKIFGVGYHVPPRVVTNEDLVKTYGIDTSDEWVQQRTGIKQRHFVDAGTTNSDLGVEAAKRALDAAGVKKEEIDFILYATLSQDHEFPGTACFFQAKLGIPGVPAMDVRNQCTGFLYCLSMADALVRTGNYKRILVIGSEVHSHGLDLTTRGRDVAVLFGDGAGAAVVGPAADGEESGILDVKLHADGNFAKELWIESPGCSFHPTRMTHEMIDDARIYPAMNGKTVFVHAVRRMPEVLGESLKATGKSLQDLDLLVPHQANLRINEAVAKGLGLPESKVFNTIQRFGNTTAATIPIGLSEAVAQGRLKPGMLVGLVAFGSGFTWGSALIRW